MIRRCVLTAILFVLVVSCGDEKVERAQQFLELGDVDDAERLYSHLLNLQKKTDITLIETDSKDPLKTVEKDLARCKNRKAYVDCWMAIDGDHNMRNEVVRCDRIGNCGPRLRKEKKMTMEEVSQLLSQGEIKILTGTPDNIHSTTNNGGKAHLTPVQVKQVMDKNVRRFLPCMDGQANKRADMDLIIGGDGRLISVSVRQRDEKLRQCIQSRARKIRFPSSSAPRTTSSWFLEIY